jgi:hypothetical protein
MLIFAAVESGEQCSRMKTLNVCITRENTYVGVEFCVTTRLDISFLQKEKVVQRNAWLHTLEILPFPQTGNTETGI